MKIIAALKGSLPKYYSNFNTTMPISYYDYENYNIECGKIDDYEISQKIGQGKYSEVFQGYDIMKNEKCVVKVLKPNKLSKLQREVLILKNLNHPNILELRDVVQDYGSKNYSLVFNFKQSLNLIKHYPQLKKEEIKYILKETLVAIDYAHSRGIFHRDIKPQNILTDLTCNRNEIYRDVQLIDWGLAEFYHPNQEYNTRIASRYFKSPEVLLDHRKYHLSLDSWSFGCLMAGMIFQNEPFIKGANNEDQLVKIVQIFGSKALKEFQRAHGVNIPLRYGNLFDRNYSKKNLEMFINEKNEHLCTNEALDLLRQLLEFDFQQRILPKDALLHDYFK